MFKIGEFSKMTQVSARMLRHYDKLGLLQPNVVDRFTGYRYYTLEQIPQLNRLLALKDLGFSLNEIAHLLSTQVSVEMLYEFEQPFIIDDSKFTRQFGWAAAPIEQVVQDTVRWFQANRPA